MIKPQFLETIGFSQNVFPVLNLKNIFWNLKNVFLKLEKYFFQKMYFRFWTIDFIFQFLKNPR